jgi:zinc transporter
MEDVMSEKNGLVFGWLLDGKGGGTPIDWDGARSWKTAGGPLWLHLDRTVDSCAQWLTDESGLDSIVVDALLAEETRPRTVKMGNGLLVILRGVNLNPGAEPEDMVAVRLWIDEYRVISVQARKVMAVADIDEEIQAERGPRGSSEFLAELAAGLVNRMAPVIEELDDLTDELEDQLLTGESREIRHGLQDLRRTAIALRRYLAPQRDAMARIQTEDLPWLDNRQKARLREVTDRVIHFVEDLDEIRERAAVVQDELMNRLSEQMNRNMFLLSVVAAIMLPLGFLTGLLGINVGGIPGAESNIGFLVVCALLAGVTVIEIILLRRLHWI